MSASSPRIAIDCRWLNTGGAGRTTELMLRALRSSELPARWLLWGPPQAIEAFAWPGCEIVPEARDPRALRGQRNWFGVPAAELVVFLHQQRPLRPVPAITVIHDTIPLRHGSSAPVRTVKRAFLRRAAGMSKQVLTDSEFSRRCIVADLGAGPDRVTVVRWPADAELASRVLALKCEVEPLKAALYLGGLMPHKNVERLVEAFAGTEFRRSGGRLILLGASPSELAAFASRLPTGHGEYLDLRPFTGQPELEALLAAVSFLVQPSLEEGFGLPAWEALTCGVPVCASTGGSLPEITQGRADEFDPLSVDGMRQAIDRCAGRAEGWTREKAARASAEFLAFAPSLADLTRQMEEILSNILRAAGRPGAAGATSEQPSARPGAAAPTEQPAG